MVQSIIQSGPYVFLSYLSSERGRVLSIARELEKIGVRVWIDLISIPAGGNYGLAIAEGIEHCAAVLIACSPASLQSRNVKQEIQLAWKHQRPYLPLLLEPTTFTQDIEYWLEGYQWVEILDHPKEVWIPRVAQALKKLGVPTDLTSDDDEASAGRRVGLELAENPTPAPLPAAPLPAAPPLARQPVVTTAPPGTHGWGRDKIIIGVATLAIVALVLGAFFVGSWRAGSQVSSVSPPTGGIPAAIPGNGSTSAQTVPTVTGSGLTAAPRESSPATTVPRAGGASTPAAPTLSVPVMPMGS